MQPFVRRPHIYSASRVKLCTISWSTVHPCFLPENIWQKAEIRHRKTAKSRVWLEGTYILWKFVLPAPVFVVISQGGGDVLESTPVPTQLVDHVHVSCFHFFPEVPDCSPQTKDTAVRHGRRDPDNPTRPARTPFKKINASRLYHRLSRRRALTYSTISRNFPALHR